jgi:GH25 family lysozyme M1 (1,4-beta-N-acetylmuramidase)
MSTLHPNYEICGLDMSKWQIWSDPTKSLEMGVNFTILRGGNGVTRDTRLAEHRRKAEKYNIPTAFYWYWQPCIPAKDQARAMRSALQAGDTVYADFEKNSVDTWPVAATPSLITRLTLEFLEECDRMMGDELGVYTSPGWWAGWITRSSVPKFRLTARSKWVAQWRYTFTKKPYPLPHGWPGWDVWQFSGNTGPWQSKANLFGITRSASVDVNAFNGEVDRFRKLFDVFETGGGRNDME